MDDAPQGGDQPEGTADLLTIGLVVFFVALVLTVVALVVVAAVF